MKYGMLFLSFFILLLLVNKSHSKYNINNLFGFRCKGATKLRIAIRVNNKNKLECLSTDGKKCSGPFNSDQECRSKIMSSIRRLKLVQCEASQIEKKGHWCKRAHRYFFKKWHCQKETGLRTGVKLDPNSGHAMCISFNGKDCLWGKFGKKICKKLKWCKKTQARLKPLMCGTKHKIIWGHDGYSFPSAHWCKRTYAFFKYTGAWYGKKNTGLSTLVRMTNKGEIGCISPNKRDCVWNINDRRKGNNIIRKLNKRNQLHALFCGNHHKRIHGSTGLNNSRHWCHRSVKGFFYGRYGTLPSNSSGHNRKHPTYPKKENPKYPGIIKPKFSRRKRPTYPRGKRRYPKRKRRHPRRKPKFLRKKPNYRKKQKKRRHPRRKPKSLREKPKYRKKQKK